MLWQRTIADPIGAYRLYYYRKCNPKAGVRWLTMNTGWVYTT